MKINQGYVATNVPEIYQEALIRLGDRLDELVKKCVHAFVVLGQDKQPIKKSDLNRLVFSNVTNYRAVNGIIHMANEELQDVFGMQIYVYDTTFFLVNMDLGYEQYKTPRTNEENHECTWLHFVLMEIFVSIDFRSAYEDIKKALKPLEPADHDKDQLKDLLEKFTKQMYIATVRDHDASYYVWAPRALAELDLENFFQTFLKISRENNREAWPDLVRRLEKMKQLQRPVEVGRTRTDQPPTQQN